MNISVNELSQFQNFICRRKVSHKKRNGQVRLGDKRVLYELKHTLVLCTCHGGRVLGDA